MTEAAEASRVDPRASWRDLCVGAENLPDWLPRIALAEVVSRELLIVGEESSGVSCLPGGCTALLAKLEASGAVESGVDCPSGEYALRPDLRVAMLGELRRDDPDLTRTRTELVAAGLARRYPTLAVQLANWAFESRDWASLNLLWGTYSPGVLLAHPGVRAAYAEAPPEQRALLPWLSYGAAFAAAFEPVTGHLDLDLLLSAMIRDGRTLHARWEEKPTAEEKVAAGTLWMLAQATIPEAMEDPLLDRASSTYQALVRVVRDASSAENAVSVKSLTYFHSIASLVAFLRADWGTARREAEVAMLLTDNCGFSGFVAALVMAKSSSASGNTQYFGIAEKYLVQHTEHQCRVATWIEPAFHLSWADAAIRRLDRRLAEHHLRMHDVEGAVTRWFNIQPMHAMVMATFGIIWEDPQRTLAQFDSIVADADADAEVEHDRSWGSLLLRARAEVLVSMGELVRAEQLIGDLVVHADQSASIVPAARLHLCAGDFADAITTADEGIFSREISLADRAHLYAVKSAALRLADVSVEQVALAASAACAVCEQADTLVPFAMLPTSVRTLLVDEHEDHHGTGDCLINLARRRGAFSSLHDSRLPAPVRVRLTRREEVLLPLLAQPSTLREIANQQYVSVNTVRKQVVALREKLGAASRSDLIRRAHDLGLLSHPAKSGGHP